MWKNASVAYRSRIGSTKGLARITLLQDCESQIANTLTAIAAFKHELWEMPDCEYRRDAFRLLERFSSEHKVLRWQTKQAQSKARGIALLCVVAVVSLIVFVWCLIVRENAKPTEQIEKIEPENKGTAEAYQKATALGDSDAQFNLGLEYVNGNGIPQDYIKAAECFQKAAVQGNNIAQSNLGAMYYKGLGISQNYSKAAEWFQKAAMLGNAAAQSTLERVLHFSERGIGA